MSQQTKQRCVAAPHAGLFPSADTPHQTGLLPLLHWLDRDGLLGEVSKLLERHKRRRRNVRARAERCQPYMTDCEASQLFTSKRPGGRHHIRIVAARCITHCLHGACRAFWLPLYELAARILTSPCLGGSHNGFSTAEHVRDCGERHRRQLDERQLCSGYLRGGQRRLHLQHHCGEPCRRRWLRGQQLLDPVPPLLVRHMRCIRRLRVLAWLHQRRVLNTVQRQRRNHLAAAVCHLHSSRLGCAVRPQSGRHLHDCRRPVQHKLAVRFQLHRRTRTDTCILLVHRYGGGKIRFHWRIL